mmetsp:Transcript_43653/g.94752  ORF Transcript_43653/g.94752 Transcript_43653/m.94752 type:complete len:161 (-) Transcript_43653:50-532(-)
MTWMCMSMSCASDAVAMITCGFILPVLSYTTGRPARLSQAYTTHHALIVCLVDAQEVLFRDSLKHGVLLRISRFPLRIWKVNAHTAHDRWQGMHRFRGAPPFAKVLRHGGCLLNVQAPSSQEFDSDFIQQSGRKVGSKTSFLRLRMKLLKFSPNTGMFGF